MENWNPSQGVYIPNLGSLQNNITQGLQQRRLGALSQQYAGATGQQKAALGQQLNAYNPAQYKAMLGNEQTAQAMQREFLARAAIDIHAAPKEMQMQLHDDMIRRGIQSGALPPEAEAEIGKFDADELDRYIRGGQAFGDLTTSKQQDREYDLLEKKFNLEAKKLNKEINSDKIDPKEVFDRETKLRKEFTGLSGEFIKQRDAFGRIQASAQDPSAAGDLALIFNYMKVLDPGSTVREGEFATAQSSGAIPDRIWNVYNKVMSGERLAPDQRQDFVNRAEKLFQKAEGQHAQRTAQYSGLAQRAGVDPQQVLVEMGLINPPEAPDTPQTAPMQYNPQDIQAEIARRRAAGLM